MNHWITRAVTKARLNQSLEHLTAEWEVKGLIPGGRTNTKGLQKKKNLEMKVLPLPCKLLDLRMIWMTT